MADLLSRLLATARRATLCLAEIARGASGTHAYDHYVAHCRERHPERPLPTREEFYRRELTARWEGIRRCC